MSDAYKIIRNFMAFTASPDLKSKVWTWLLDSSGKERKEKALHQIWDDYHPAADACTRHSLRRFQKKAGFPLCKPSNLYRWARIAAFLLIPLVSIATAYVYVRLHTHDVRFVECIVPKGEQKEVTLPDGSVITLNSGSVFLYPTHFTGDTRSVYLSGEGHFKVAPDKKLPFVVETNHLDVCVLGTQFNVQAYPLDKRTITTLETGSVAVRKKNQTDCFVTLEPNQQLEYENRDGKFYKRNIDASVYSGWTKGEMNFVSQSFREILKTLERRYAVSIRLSSDLTESDRINSDLYTIKFKYRDSISHVLDIVTKTVGGITYKVEKDETISICPLK